VAVPRPCSLSAIEEVEMESVYDLRQRWARA